MSDSEQHAAGRDDSLPGRVTTLELFFDLVFAFTITQLTALLVHRFSPAGALEAVLVLGVLWWIEGGYALRST
jgi:low temperature requirement protein LtrA